MSPLYGVAASWFGMLCVLGAGSYPFWRTFFTATMSLAWDGSAHFAVLRIYDAGIFPGVFGWTGAFFAGMPFPNFYPPLWFWTAAALHHCGVPLLFSAKLLLVGSVFLSPLALGWLASRLVQKPLAGPIGALLGFVPLVSESMKPEFAGGLTLSSTFNSGIYTEPLSFLLLLLALGALFEQRRNPLAPLYTAVLFAAVLLSNVFVAIAAAPMLLGYLVAPRPTWESARRAGLIAVLSLALSAFWWVPVVKGYWTVVTLPLDPPMGKVISGGMAVWLLVGLVCNAFYAWRGSDNLKRYCWGIAGLCGSALLSYVPGFEGFPLQLPRFVEIIVVLLAVPISAAAEKALSRGLAWLRGTTAKATPLWRQACYLCAGGALLGVAVTPARLDSSLYSPDRAQALQPVLEFGRSHKLGKYLVQVPHVYHDRYSARALDAYLGAQGNEVAVTAYRESSTGSLFYEPLHEIISGLSSSFGISSSIDGDPGLLKEPADRSLRRLDHMGIRYIVRLATDKFRSPVLANASLALSGPWEVYELPVAERPHEEKLSFLPALVLGDISYKQRRAGHIEMNRLLEEQFRGADFDVTLVQAHGGEDGLRSRMNGFGALIFTDYPKQTRTDLVDLVRSLPVSKPVFLFPKPSPVYTELSRLAKSRPNIHILDTSDIEEGEWLGGGSHSTTNLHAIESLWAQIANTLRDRRTPVPAQCVADGTGPCPTLIHYAYDAWWHTADDSPIYLAGPATIMVFGTQPVELTPEQNEDLARKAAAAFTEVTYPYTMAIHLLPDGQGSGLSGIWHTFSQAIWLTDAQA